MSAATRICAFLVPHTHWDREWYQPFAVFRARLVEVIDRVLEILETNPAYTKFTLDGQAVVLDDYLAVRPENEERLRRLVQAGRLRIGPWYVLADEFLVSPEALVRNMLLGTRICRRFGEPMPVGYTPDSFGHISQLPLIVAGFGFDSIVFERGVGDEGERLRGEFRWRAADGKTELFAAHLLGTYSPAAAIGHVDWELGDPYDPKRAVGQAKAVLYGASQDLSYLPQWLGEAIQRVDGGITAYAQGRALMLLNGSDHLFPQPNIPDVIRDLNAAIPEIEFRQGDVEDFVRLARATVGDLETHQGEFRGSRYQHVLSGVFSARLYIKQANFAAETLLERYVEPVSALAWLRGQAWPADRLDQSWRLLLQNHPHDSICGCSVDLVHREMLVRYDSVTMLGDGLIERGFATLAGAAGATAAVAFNPVPQAGPAMARHVVEVPAGRGARLRVLDAAGNPVPAQLRIEPAFPPGKSDTPLDRVTVDFLAELPALGVAGFRLDTSGEPASVAPRVEAGTDGIANAWLRLDAGADGALTLTDRRSGERYPLALAFEDEADAGDEYDFSPLAVDTPIRLDRAAKPAELVESGPLRATLRLSYAATLPAELTPDRKARTGEVPFTATIDLSLDAASPRLDVAVTLDNAAKDHRLRLRVATGCRTDRVLVDGHFDVLERTVGAPDGKGWFQKPQGTNHQRLFVAAGDGRRGLAVLNKGLPEYEAIATASGVDLAVTLVRAVGWLSRDDMLSRPQGAGPALPTPEAQCLGTHRYALALYPFAGAWDESGLVVEAQRFAAPPRVQGAATPVAPASLLSLPDGLVLAAAKKAEDRDSLIVRFWNPGTRDVAGTVQLGHAPREAHRTNLAETRLETLAASAAVPVRVGPKEVRTLEFVF